MNTRCCEIRLPQAELIPADLPAGRKDGNAVIFRGGAHTDGAGGISRRKGNAKAIIADGGHRQNPGCLQVVDGSLKDT